MTQFHSGNHAQALTGLGGQPSINPPNIGQCHEYRKIKLEEETRPFDIITSSASPTKTSIIFHETLCTFSNSPCIFKLQSPNTCHSPSPSLSRSLRRLQPEYPPNPSCWDAPTLRPQVVPEAAEWGSSFSHHPSSPLPHLALLTSTCFYHLPFPSSLAEASGFCSD